MVSLFWYYVFPIFFIFEHNWIFFEFICFLVKLSHYYQFHLKESIKKKCTAMEKGVYEYFYCFCYIVYDFWADAKLSRKILWFWFCFCLCLPFFVVIRLKPNNDRSQLFPAGHITHNSWRFQFRAVCCFNDFEIEKKNKFFSTVHFLLSYS